MARFAILSSQLDEEDAAIPLGSAIRLLEATAEELSCSDFGLRLAEQQSVRCIGPLALPAQFSGTVAAGLQALAGYMPYHSNGIHVGVDRDTQPHLRRLTFNYQIDSCPERRQATEGGISIFQRVLQMMTGNTATVDHVLFRHPANLPVERYRDWFPFPLKFNQEVNALVVEAAILERTIDQANPDLLRVVASYVSGIIAKQPSDVVAQVSALISDLLPSGKCTLAHVADVLHIQERTLQRRLTRDGVRYESLLDQIRRQRAKEFLAQRNISLTRVASLIGFADQSSLNRACLRWFGTTPKAVRNGSAD